MHTTEQLNAALAGRYAIDRLIGEGGMATVYLARDVRHSRKVAVKVLRPDLGAVVGGERFLSEIQVTANLQHPNLLPLFDSGEAGGLLFYVMPLVEGESLRARLLREKQLPVEEAVHIATSVAGALDYAHRHGVIHRDLKPENILMHDGQPLVADFGIALAVSNAGGNRITQTGLSLGTPQYMSPEQATGDRTIDARTDIYSLGAVVYEMLTGDAPHTGSSSQAIIARMLTEKPRSIQTSRPNVPAHVAAAVEHALEKLPADRWATAKEFSEALAGTRPVTMAATSQQATAPAAPSQRIVGVRELGAWALALAGLITAGYFATRRPPAPVPGKFAVELPDSVTTTTLSAHSVALSHDGTKLALVGVRTSTSTRMIYLRRFDEPVAQPIRGTEGALYHSFSPDGGSLLFIVGAALRTLSVNGGTPQTLADSADAQPASMGVDRRVLYAFRQGLWSVSADGGDRRLVASPDSSRGIRRLGYPDVLPGARHAIAVINHADGDSSRLALVSLADGRVEELGIPGRSPRYSTSGHIIFSRPGGVVFAAPFSLRKRAVTGPPVLLLEQVRQSGTANPITALGVSHTGAIVYESGVSGTIETMYLVDRRGTERALKGEPRMFREPRVSPDGRHVAVRIGSGQFDGGLWIHDIASGVLTRLTRDSNSTRGEWTRDGRSVVFVEQTNTPSERLSSVPWDGSAAARVLLKGTGAMTVFQVSMGRPGAFSAVRRGDSGSGLADILLAKTDSLGGGQPFVATPGVNETDPRISPSGRTMAYVSNKSGRIEVFVTPVPGPGAHVQVSIDGGQEPAWSSDGATLFFRGPTHMMTATVVERPALAVTRRETLFPDIYRRYAPHAAYDVMPGGKELLMTRGPTARSTIYVIVNWPQLSRVRGAGEGERQ